MWDLDLNQVQLESDDEFALTTVLPQGVTADGYLVASVSNDTSVEIVAVDVKTGRPVARWAVPKEYRNGFQVNPGMTLFDGGIVLTRNFERVGAAHSPTTSTSRSPRATAIDIGVFTFPEPDNSGVGCRAHRRTGRHRGEGARRRQDAPRDSTGDRDAGAFSTGARLVAYAGNTLTGVDPKSGDEKWTLEVDDGRRRPHLRRARARPEGQDLHDRLPRRRQGRHVRHAAARDVRPTARCWTAIKVPAAARSVSRIEVHEGVVYVITGDAVVSRLDDGAARRARQAGAPAVRPWSGRRRTRRW